LNHDLCDEIGMLVIGRLPIECTRRWPMLLGPALIISSTLGLWTGEWKGAPGPFKTMLGGIAVVIFAICILGYSKGL
jgi:hypothetical protein